MHLTNFNVLVDRVKSDTTKKRMAVAVAADSHTLEAVIRAMESGIVSPILVGDKSAISAILNDLNVTIPDGDIHDVPDPSEACAYAVKLIRDGAANFLMKGKVDTGVLLKAVVNKETGLGTGRTMSHFAMFQVPSYHKLLVCVDGGMVTYPTLAQKRDIIENTVTAMRGLGYDCPKVGILACMEKVNPKMPETVEADALKQMNLAGEIEHCIVEGPISYDCAISREIAEFKGFNSPVSGDVDVLITHDIHAGNLIGKLLICTANATMAGFVVGAKCPIVLSSRGASAEEKYLSIVTAAAASN